MATENNFTTTQQNIKTTLTRRALLGQMLALGSLAAVPLLAPAAPKTTDYVVDLPLPAGPLARTEIIDRWLDRIGDLSTALDRYFSFLLDARAMPPAQVDGVKLVTLENELHNLCDGFAGWVECDIENSIIEAATGRAASGVCIEAELLSRDLGDPHYFDRAFWQREVDACAADHPEERARLQAALDLRFGGAR
jgi:hypothetical protein